jgi:hypothetical protein
MKTTLSRDFRLDLPCGRLIHPRRFRRKRIVLRRTIFQFGRPPGRFAPTYDRPELPESDAFLGHRRRRYKRPRNLLLTPSGPLSVKNVDSTSDMRNLPFTPLYIETAPIDESQRGLLWL